MPLSFDSRRSRLSLGQIAYEHDLKRRLNEARLSGIPSPVPLVLWENLSPEVRDGYTALGEAIRADILRDLS